MFQAKNKIGASQAEALREIAEAISTLQRVCPEEFSDELRGSLRRVRGWHAKVAAIGQVKAGKSAFLSAMIGRPGLLPSEVNPWTSVVTNLRFGIPGDPVTGATFQFFDEASWQRVTIGDEETRRLASEILPGFRTEVLRQQTEVMRERARRRLGRDYDQLIGSRHQHETISTDLLEQYVCAGPSPEEGRDDSLQGRYAAITRQADLYFPRGEFAVPVVVTDTPGVNDPFLVRDALTCQSLADSDIFVMTLSAHQALTEVDVALVRMLSRHSGKSVVVYVNRIDEVDRFEVKAAKIKQDVERRLAAALPGLEFRVIVGSAHWAEIALSGDRAIANHADLTNSPELAIFLETMRGYCPADPKEMLSVASGISQVKEAISELIDTKLGPALIAEVSANASAIISTLKAMTETQSRRLRSNIDNFDMTTITRVREKMAIEALRLNRVAADLREQIGRANHAMDQILHQSLLDLRDELDRVSERLVDGEVARLEELVKGDKVANDHDFSMLPMREAIENSAVLTYAHARRAMDQIAAAAAIALAEKGAEFGGGNAAALNLSELPSGEIVPVFLSKASTMSLALQRKRGWKFWRRPDVDMITARDKLKRLILVEIAPSLDNLAGIFEIGLGSRADALRTRLSLMAKLYENAINQGLKKIEKEDTILGDGLASGRLRERLTARIESDLRELEKRAQLYSDQEARLLEVVQNYGELGAA